MSTSAQVEQKVEELVAAIRAMVLNEVIKKVKPNGTAPAASPTLGARKKRNASGRLPRRSAADVGAVVDKICSLLAKAPEGLRAEALREKLGLEAKELPRPIALALKEKRIKKSGNKRATTYTIGNGKRTAT
jgi:hypothetical protein